MLLNCGVGEDLRVPWTTRSNQSILREISPEYSLEDDADTETPVLWLPDAKNWLTGKDPDAGRDWGQEEKGMTEDEMVGRHRLDGCEFGWTPGVGDGQGGLVRCNSWGRKESDTTERLNWLTDAKLWGQTLIHSKHLMNVYFYYLYMVVIIILPQSI